MFNMIANIYLKNWSQNSQKKNVVVLNFNSVSETDNFNFLIDVAFHIFEHGMMAIVVAVGPPPYRPHSVVQQFAHLD